MNFKDLFSRHATDYARFRPHYPASLFTWLATIAPANRGLAIDVGAGNGQAAIALGPHFDRVIAVDPSAAQLAEAAPVANVEYRVAAAEATGLDAAAADIMVAAQAFHWFDHAAFFAEARRVLRPGGALVIWCYGLARIDAEIDALVHELYETHLGAFWEPERRLVETGYRSVEVPFEEIAAPGFDMRASWTLNDLVGYLGTWSALRRYVREHEPTHDAAGKKGGGSDPATEELLSAGGNRRTGIAAVQDLFARLDLAWGSATERVVSWPLAVRAFRV